MLVDFVWNVFKKTGSVDSYVLMKEIEAEHRAEKTNDIVENRFVGEKCEVFK